MRAGSSTAHEIPHDYAPVCCVVCLGGTPVLPPRQAHVWWNRFFVVQRKVAMQNDIHAKPKIEALVSASDISRKTWYPSDTGVPEPSQLHKGRTKRRCRETEDRNRQTSTSDPTHQTTFNKQWFFVVSSSLQTSTNHPMSQGTKNIVTFAMGGTPKNPRGGQDTPLVDPWR